MDNQVISQAIAEAKKLRKSGNLKVCDRYKQMNAPKECKGISQYGEEIFGYVYNPDYFIKSDVTGMMCRHYIKVNDVVMHPDELDKVAVVNGQVKVSKRESIAIITPNGKDRVYSFDTALSDINYTWYKPYRDPEITIASNGREFTKPQSEWRTIYHSIKTWIPRQGDKVLISFQEWADQN